VSHGDHDHRVVATDAAATRALWIALVANGGFLVVEVAGGIAFDSLALLADAAHMASDVVGLVIALIAQSLVRRPASSRRTFGWRRAEALGAQANAVLILAVAIWIFVEAANRISDPADVAGGGMLAVATAGLVVNVVSAVVIARSMGRNLNMRGAFVHMLADAAGSVGAIVAAVGVIVSGADWLDPAVSIFIGLLIVWSAFGLLRATTQVLLEGAPRGLDVDEVEATLQTAAGVEAVHHLHVWEVASDLPALSAHVVLTGEPTLHEAQARGDQLKVLLANRFGITHATLELECHDCEDPEPR
jgi:cobalt-zinc-cadmium efflux system protein